VITQPGADRPDGPGGAHHHDLALDPSLVVELGEPELQQRLVRRPQGAGCAVAVAGRDRQGSLLGHCHACVTDDLGERTEAHDLCAELPGGLGRREQPCVGELGTVGHQLFGGSAHRDEPALGLRAGGGLDAGDVGVRERRRVRQSLLHHVDYRRGRHLGDRGEGFDALEELLRQGMDDEGEPTLPPATVRIEHAGLKAGRDDHVKQIVVGQAPGAGYGGQHHGLEESSNNGDVKRLRCGVEHHVDAAAGQFGEPVIRDGRGDDGLAGQILQPEAGQLVVGGNHHVAVTRGPCMP